MKWAWEIRLIIFVNQYKKVYMGWERYMGWANRGGCI